MNKKEVRIILQTLAPCVHISVDDMQAAKIFRLALDALIREEMREERTIPDSEDENLW